VDATQIAPMGGYDEAATSIADIASLMKGGAPGGGPPQQEEEGATEIMSGDSIPDFASMFNGGGPPEDGTVEMQNPLELLQKAGWNAPGGGAPGVGAPEEDGATEIVSADMVFGGGPPPGGQQAGGAPAPGQPRPRSKTQFGGWNAQDVAAAGAQQAQPAPQQPAPQQPALSPPQPAGGFGGGDPFAGVDMGGPVPTPEQPPAPAAPAAAAGPNPNHQGPWKLKTSFGLTYEFQDTKSLLGWMSSRDDLSGYSLSEGTESFYPIEQFPQVMGQLSGAGARSLSGQVGAVSPTPAPAPAGGQAGGFGGQPGGGFGGQPGGFGGQPGGFGDAAGGQPGGFGGQPGGFGGPMGGAEPPRQPGQKIENNEFKPPSKSKGKSLTAILVALFLVFGGVAIVFSLHLAKIIDIKALISGEPAQVEQPEQPSGVEAKAPDDGAEAAGGDEVEEPEIDEATKKEVDQMISDARDELENNKLMSALSKLKTAKMLDPNRFEVYDMLADVHEQMGEADKAAEVREEVKKLRAAGSDTP
jgi:flagellar basal body-associated protein FliL